MEVSIAVAESRGLMDDQEDMSIPLPHILIFPLPIQSAVNTMLKLAEILCLAGLEVTFLNTSHNQRRLVRHTNIQSRLKRFSGRMHFETVSDGLAEDNPRSAIQFGELCGSLQANAVPFLRERLSSSKVKGERVSCVIVEALFHYVVDVGNEAGVPVIPFETVSPSCLWVYFCFPNIIEAGEHPSPGKDLDGLVTSVPGMEGILRIRDLPYFGPGDYVDNANAKSVSKVIQQLPRTPGLILNTFEDLDGPYLSHIRAFCPNLYAIGPVHHHWKTRLEPEATSSMNHSNSLWEEDRSCINWLNTQPSKSVIYVSIGSLKVMKKAELMELWHGLVNSRVRFLWVVRPGSLHEEELDQKFLKELVDGSEGRGYIVSWAPQEEVLAHPAVGGFLTHNGWASTLESIVEGVPMICWPEYVDQRVTSRLVSEVWKIGLDMKDMCDRLTVEEKVKDVMEIRKEEFQKSVEEMSKLATQSVVQGGSSYTDLQRLINDLKMLSMQVSVKTVDVTEK